MTFPLATVTTPCGAKTRAGTPCKSAAMPNGRCRMHGGKSLSGVASPAFKDGRYSKHIPSRLAARYQQAVDDPELLNIRHEIALVEARVTDLLTRVDTGEAATAWKEAEELNGKIQKAIHDSDYGELLLLTVKLDRVIGDARTDIEAWAQVMSLIEQRRKLVESEQKRLVSAQQMLSTEQAMTFAAAVLSAVKTHVTDRKVLQAITMDIQRLATKDDVGVTV